MKGTPAALALAALLPSGPALAEEAAAPPPAPRFDLLDARLLGGGHPYTWAVTIAVGPDGCPVLAGNTMSREIPVRNAVQVRWSEGVSDAFVVKLDPTGTRVLFGTYLGGNYLEQVKGVAVAGDGTILVAGITLSPDFPTTPGAFQGPASQPGYRGFVSRIDPEKGRFVYSTLLGDRLGGFQESIQAIAADAEGGAIVTGRLRPDTLGLPPATASEYVSLEGTMPYVARLRPDGSGLSWTTPLDRPGSRTESAAIAVAPDGSVAVVGTTMSTRATASTFPSLPVAEGPARDGYFGFFARFDRAGRPVAARRLDDLPWTTACSVAMDASGGALVGGCFIDADVTGVAPPSRPGERHAWASSLRFLRFDASGRPAGAATFAGSMFEDRPAVTLARDGGWAIARTASPEVAGVERPVPPPGERYSDRLFVLGLDPAMKVRDRFPLGLPFEFAPFGIAASPRGDVFAFGNHFLADPAPGADVALLLRLGPAGSATVPGGEGDLRRPPGWAPKPRVPAVLPVATAKVEADAAGAGGSTTTGKGDGAESGDGATAQGAGAEGATGSGMHVTAGRLSDRPGLEKDRFRLEGTLDAPDPDAPGGLAAFDPVRDGLRISVGDRLYPFVLEIRPGDGGWRSQGESLLWESGGPRSRATVLLPREGGRFSIEVIGFDFPGPPRNPITVLVEGMGPDGLRARHQAMWQHRAEGRFRLDR